jgi:hypothetical protein
MKLSSPDNQTKLGKYLPLKQEGIKIIGKVSYHEGSRGHNKIIFKKDLFKVCKFLLEKTGKFTYELEHFNTLEEKEQFVEWLMKNINNPESWPLFLRFKRTAEENQNVI